MSELGDQELAALHDDVASASSAAAPPSGANGRPPESSRGPPVSQGEAASGDAAGEPTLTAAHPTKRRVTRTRVRRRAKRIMSAHRAATLIQARVRGLKARRLQRKQSWGRPVTNRRVVHVCPIPGCMSPLLWLCASRNQ